MCFPFTSTRGETTNRRKANERNSEGRNERSGDQVIVKGGTTRRCMRTYGKPSSFTLPAHRRKKARSGQSVRFCSTTASDPRNQVDQKRADFGLQVVNLSRRLLLRSATRRGQKACQVFDKKGPRVSQRYPRAIKRLATSCRKRCKFAAPNRKLCCSGDAARRRPLATIGSRST